MEGAMKYDQSAMTEAEWRKHVKGRKRQVKDIDVMARDLLDALEMYCSEQFKTIVLARMVDMWIEDTKKDEADGEILWDQHLHTLEILRQ